MTQTHDIDDDAREDALTHLLERLDVRTIKTRITLTRRQETARAARQTAARNAETL